MLVLSVRCGLRILRLTSASARPCELAATVPTTVAGVAAITGFVREMTRELGDSFFQDRDAVAYAESLDTAVRRLTGLKPGDLAADRLHELGAKDQAVAAGLLANGMGNTVMASGPRPRLRSGRNSTHC
jgi:hypothetical protein